MVEISKEWDISLFLTSVEQALFQSQQQRAEAEEKGLTSRRRSLTS